MKTEDIDKRIGMPDVDAEWENFEREVIDKETASKKSITMWGLSIAASIALVAGIFLWGNVFKEQADNTLAKVEQPSIPDSIIKTETTSPVENASEKNVSSEPNMASENDKTSEHKMVAVRVQRPTSESLPKSTLSDTEEKSNTPVEPPKKQEIVFSSVEQSPSYPGGGKALMEFIKTNLRYPELAKEYGAKGRVVMSFMVDSIGYVSDIKVTKYLRMSYDTLRLSQETVETQEQVKEQIARLLGEESTRVLSQMQRWSPGKMEGKTRSMRYVVSVQFP